MQDLVEVANKLSSITVDKRDTICKTIPTLPQLVSIANLMIMLLKNVLFYKLGGGKRGQRWEIRMYS